MFGFNHLPNKLQQNIYTFYANANSGSSGPSGSFIAWNVPETAAVLHFLVIGGGGGGGSGHFSLAGGGNTSGGAGGAAGGLITATIPTVLLPKTLYLQVGQGGEGGAPVGTAFGNTAPTVGNPGRNGTRSYVCAFPEINAGSIILLSSTTEPGGGGGGVAGTSTTGTAISIATFNSGLRWAGLTGNVITPTAGGATAAAGAGGSVTYAMLPTGGCGGGGYGAGAVRNGGSVTLTNILSLMSATVTGGSGTATAGATGGTGNAGVFRYAPFITTGGGGGGNSAGTGGVAGDGGPGAYGCGGGGGGAALGASGRGGSGGGGLIIIIAG
jgi:hypothetical protein